MLFSLNPDSDLDGLLKGRHKNAFLLTDSNVEALVDIPPVLASLPRCVIPAGEQNKNLLSATQIWEFLGKNGARRNSILVCFGGGMITDLGGFAASLFKRGISHINVPTSLLAAIDASVGAKTGIDFNGLKNEIGTFAEPLEVVISSRFFPSLPLSEFLSGYGEMLKHALLDSPKAFAALLSRPPSQTDDPQLLLDVIKRSVGVKKRFVDADPRECGPRKALNLGHTTAHALEAIALERGKPLPHGVAVARGLVVAATLSSLFCNFPSLRLHQLANHVKETFGGGLGIECPDYQRLIDRMTHDKKNTSSKAISFTLLADIGLPLIDQSISPGQISTALDIARDLIS